MNFLQYSPFTAVAGIVAFIIFSPPAQVMSVTPIVLDMSTMGNNNHSQMPVEIAVSRINLDENGEMHATPVGGKPQM